jgi:hypothetical protein
MIRWIYLLPLLVLTACADDSDVVQVGTFLLNSASGSAAKVPRERAAAIPYATVGLEFGSSDQVLFILGASIEDELDWFAGDQVFVRTRGGRVIRTAGLPYDLGGLRALPVAGGNAAGGAAPTFYSLDFPDLGVFDATAQCTSRDLGDDTVEIFGVRIPTRHIAEHCSIQALRWNFDNDFWRDRTSGYVWRSSQHIHPKAPPLILEVLRPEQINGG